MCTSIMAGKQATDNNTILLARNEDYNVNDWNKYLTYRYHPAYYNPHNKNIAVKDNIWTLGNGLRVPVPEKSFKYSSTPDAASFREASHYIGDRFFFEARGINEVNFALSATNSMENIKNIVTKHDPFIKPGIEESIIPTLLLPQATSAKDAINILSNYIEKYGAAEGNGILLGDPTESWYMEIGSGHHWIAVRVPDDKYIAIANGLRIHSVNLDSDDVMHSKGIFDFVINNKLLNNPQKNNFNFAMAFGSLNDPKNVYNTDRIWLMQSLLSPSIYQDTRQKQYPLFLKPDKKIEVEDVMKVLRSNYKGTPLEGIATRAIGVERTAESHIIELDNSMPNELKGIIWQALSTPLGAPYMPLYACFTDIPVSYELSNNIYSPNSAYWSFRGLNGIQRFDPEDKVISYQQFWKNKEHQFIQEHKLINELLRKLYEKDPDLSIGYANNYSSGITYKMVGDANKLRDKLITNISNITSPKFHPKPHLVN